MISRALRGQFTDHWSMRLARMLSRVFCINFIFTSFCTGAIAQTNLSPVADKTDAPLCQVLVAPDVSGRAPQLRAMCNGRFLFLGQATSFDVIESKMLQALLIDARFGDERRILLLTQQNDGQVLQEDLTGQIARAAGRGPMSSIDGVDLDFAQFTQSGAIAVQQRANARFSAKATHIDLAQQITSMRERLVSQNIQK